MPTLDRPSRRVYVEHGVRYLATMPASEVCLHMRVTGKPMILWLCGRAGRESVQLARPDSTPFSAPILTGEAGLYRDARGRLYGHGLEPVERV